MNQPGAMEHTTRNAANGLGSDKARILIVDDSLTVRMDLDATFESAEYDVTLCETLAAARAALARQTPSLVVLDVLLPDGDGMDLLREIKSTRSPVLPVMLLSTEAEVSDRVRGMKTGADDYVGKPYDTTYVLARARELIGRAACAPESAAPRLLLIDDSATSRQQFQSILESAGYRVITAGSGEEGLRRAFALRPDGIIVDRMMPGIDGDTVIRRLKQDITLRNTPCLLLTASAGNGEELHMLDAGADAYLGKEVDAAVFLARIAALIRSGSPAPAVNASASSLLGAKKILAVDDSITYLNEVSAELRQEGYDVVQALSGKEALDLLEVQTVDGILLDVRMPGLSGNETCRIIKQRPGVRGIPLLMLTASEGAEALIEGINSGADDYICKSSDFTVLKARLRAQLRRKQFEDENRQIREELLGKSLEAAQARADREIAQARASLVDELEKKTRELDAFAYAVSHDLRSPLRTIHGFSQALLEDFADNLPAEAARLLHRVQAAAERMGRLIDALLELSRTTTGDMNRQAVDLSQLAHAVAAEDEQPGRAWKRRTSLQLENARWTVELWPAASALAAQESVTANVVLAAGLLLSVLLGLAVYLAQAARVKTRQAERARAELEKEMAERRRAEQELDQFFTLAPDMLCIAVWTDTSNGSTRPGSACSECRSIACWRNRSRTSCIRTTRLPRWVR